MAEEANFMTHDDFAGKKPTVNLRFPVIWTNTGPENDNVRETGTSVISTPNVRDWESFKRELFAPFEHSIDDVVTYIDSDDDQIPIESQCEFDEALKIATARATQKPRPVCLYLVVERGSQSETNNKKKNIYTQNSSPLTMPPINLNDGGHEFPPIQRQFIDTRYNVKEPERSDDAVPKWFTSYIQKMKEEIVTEVSARVTKAVMEALQKQRENRFDSGVSNSRESDSEDSMIGESDGRKGNIRELDLLDDVKTGDSSSRSSHHRYQHSRRRNRNRNLDKHHTKFEDFDKRIEELNKKLSKSHSVSQAPNNLQTSSPRCHQSSSANGRGNDEKPVKMCDNEDLFGAQSTSGYSEHQNTSSKVSRDPENLSEGLDTPYRRMIASGIRQMSFTPVDSTDLPKAPILKLRLADSRPDEDVKPTQTEEKLRMYSSLTVDEIFERSNDRMANEREEKPRMCSSITGNEMFERSDDRVLDYCTLSDSDNISIISDVSHNSDIQRISNSFEIIVEQSMNIRDESDEERDLVIAMDHVDDNGEKEAIDDPDVRRDSSSFELLSEPASPSLSIHIDEDHFSPGEKDTKNDNINEPTVPEKIQNKLKPSTLVIDAQGQIHDRSSSVEIGDEDSERSIFPKRTDGSYSFVAETLPGSTKESIMGPGRPDLLSDGAPVADESTSEKDSEKLKESLGGSNIDETTFEENSNDAAHESFSRTQSFHSHTANLSGNERWDFEARSSTTGPEEEISSTTRSHIFVDHNVNKGLGDTKQSSPKKKEFRSKSHENSKWGKCKPSRRQSSDSNSSRRSANSCQNERPRRFENWSTTRSRRIPDFDFPPGSVPTMHILPESLLFGAVHVAASAYSTARRVCDKILTAQTKAADRSKFGRR
ncbi:uncharacterized protein [Venturia canescens]|uniref:uncharacterized protein isoform X2 n=1 Tax=Venturia canescens TaxID=32260 RepID=UPI001C9C11E3|nr:uncharacterized protein LOC122410025 isoform X2 [Venturia canescens]